MINRMLKQNCHDFETTDYRGFALTMLFRQSIKFAPRNGNSYNRHSSLTCKQPDAIPYFPGMACFAF